MRRWKGVLGDAQGSRGAMSMGVTSQGPRLDVIASRGWVRVLRGWSMAWDARGGK